MEEVREERREREEERGEGREEGGETETNIDGRREKYGKKGGWKRETEREREKREQYQFWVPVRPPFLLSPGQHSPAPHCTTTPLPVQCCLHTPRERKGGGREKRGGREGGEGGWKKIERKERVISRA